MLSLCSFVGVLTLVVSGRGDSRQPKHVHIWPVGAGFGSYLEPDIAGSSTSHCAT